MLENSENCRSHCPINFLLEHLGDKWTLLVVRDLMFHHKRYYGDFLKSDEKISTNILAERLQRLESSGIVTKTPDQKNLSKSVYALTEKGKDLLPLMMEVSAWSKKYDRQSNAPAAFGKKYTSNRDQLLAELKTILPE